MRPLLSIGIIFKNESRCLARCLESLDKLRAAVPCELVMADTGSDDGSREIAKRYADVLFDFEWVDDFSAARNAVLDRCSGEWFMSIDADEWLDGDIRGLLKFIQGKQRPEPACALTVRNYISLTKELYTDFLAVRIVRVPTGLRYIGTIHEHWAFPDGRNFLAYPLDELVLHHDGYVMLNDGSAAGKEKLERNMCLLQKELQRSPKNLQLLIQCIESCGQDYEKQLPYIRRGMELIMEKRDGWVENGAYFLRYAVRVANRLDLPEYGDWIALIEKLFPDSICTTVDVQFDAVEHAWRNMDCPEVIFRGKLYIKGVQDYRVGQFNLNDMLQGSLISASFHQETSLRVFTARAQIYESQPEAAMETLQVLDYDTMEEEQTAALLETIMRLHTLSYLDTAPLLQEFWGRINEPKPSEEMAERRRRQFITSAANWFILDYIEDETAWMKGDVSLNGLSQVRAEEWNILSKLTLCRHGYTLFKPLVGQMEIGTAAVLMDEEDAETAAQLLSSVERFEEFPIQALLRALLREVPFPDRLLNIEEMDSLAARLTQEPERLRAVLWQAAAHTETYQALAWARGLALAAVQACKWDDEEEDMELARCFAEMERKFLPICYAPEALKTENLFLLPPLHRFGWHCAQAFDALDAGDAVGYTRQLRTGLASCEAVRPLVEFLLEYTPELQAPPPSAELLALAEKVRMMLSAYPEDDPAVAALKTSPVYQKVAYLIEGDGK